MQTDDTIAAPQADPTEKPPRSHLMRQYELVERVRSYDPDVNEDLLNRAYVFSMQAHGSQTRASGDPFFSHPLEVAGILTEMKMDSTTIATALLHDTVEDTLASLDDIQKQFGPGVARLVDGVTKLSRIELQTDQGAQAENFRKLVVAMSEDIRVLLVKLADRLHNMRTLRHLKDPEKRRRIARETLDIYAPLAQRIGIEKMQDELEDLAFGELNPDARDSIIARLNFLRHEGGAIAQKVLKELHSLLDESGIPATVEGREKTPYSVWRKMQRKNVGFEQLSDIMAFRILVDSPDQCYHALGVIHSHYHVIPGRFKDYISTPKPNRYQSLHTGIMGPEQQRIEIQIRTREMHEVAELGVAAHWGYKQDNQGAPRTDGLQYRWLRELLDIVEHAQKPEEFLENTKLELFQDQVFCFSPKGDLIALPNGASPVDFAYAIHGRVGDACVGAKVNGRMVPLRTVLRNGDQVEIVTQKGSTPSPTWERFVVTGKAKSCIRRFIRSQQRTEYVLLGKSILEKVCKQEGVDFSDKAFEAIAKNFQSVTAEDLFAGIGASLHPVREVFNAAFPDHRPKQPEKSAGKGVTVKPKTSKNSAPLTLKGLIPGMAVHYARCCHPLPGDPIVGIVTTGKGVTIHTTDCETLESFVRSPERWIDVGWNDEKDKVELMVGRLDVVLINRPNSLATMTTIIAKNNGNIFNMKITNRTPEFFDITVDVEVHDLKHLTIIIAALRASSSINSVERTKGR
ncbi:MAG: bifunctional (p)ppGpp synthetase/guanosine-3',5'-bis(diphosphate) 3'-pyrophosphohydrolase [Bdellovibrionales bacterium]